MLHKCLQNTYLANTTLTSDETRQTNTICITLKHICPQLSSQLNKIKETKNIYNIFKVIYMTKTFLDRCEIHLIL